ncbi:MAG TPA: nuclear transport factor 2 family protein [Terriglobales bacterium]|nr:nuclear transport factor 2 family protein [Terriglobales bacterium]
MRRALLLIMLLFLSVCSNAQLTTKKHKHATAEHKAAGVDAALLQKVWDAWCTLDAANAAKYYDAAPGNVFFDITPLAYHGWSEYEKGVKPVLAGFKSASAKLDDIRVHPAGNAYWATAIVHMAYETKDGASVKGDWRYTSVWEKRGGEWRIVHDHASVPLPSEEKKK